MMLLVRNKHVSPIGERKKPEGHIIMLMNKPNLQKSYDQLRNLASNNLNNRMVERFSGPSIRQLLWETSNQ